MTLDAMMPLLLCQAIQDQLRDGECLMAFLDDLDSVTLPDRVGPVHAIVQEELRVHACKRIHCGKTKVWNKAGTRPAACGAFERMARIVIQRATVWKGPGVPAREQCIKDFLTPLRHCHILNPSLKDVQHGCCFFTVRLLVHGSVGLGVMGFEPPSCQHLEVNLFPKLSEAGKALVRSQAGPGGGLALSTCPTCRITSLDSHLLRVLLLRRLQMPLFL